MCPYMLVLKRTWPGKKMPCARFMLVLKRTWPGKKMPCARFMLVLKKMPCTAKSLVASINCYYISINIIRSF